MTLERSPLAALVVGLGPAVILGSAAARVDSSTVTIIKVLPLSWLHRLPVLWLVRRSPVGRLPSTAEGLARVATATASSKHAAGAATHTHGFELQRFELSITLESIPDGKAEEAEHQKEDGYETGRRH